MANIIEFKDYREFLKKHFQSLGARKGHKADVAAAIGIQASYLSRVLAGQAHLNMEQAFDLADHLALSAVEKSLFLLLVQKERAGTHKLKQFYLDEIKKIVENQNSLKNILETQENITSEVRGRYYSHWVYSALHILVSVPAFQSRAKLLQAIDLDADLVNRAIDFLVESGFIKDRGGSLSIGPVHIHLPHDSPYIVNHHTNWRLESIHSLSQSQNTDLHYTGVWSLSKKTSESIRQKLLRVIQDNIDEVKESPEEEVYCYTLDFFKIK